MFTVCNVWCRTHLSIEGGSRLLARAIKGLAAPPLKQFRRHDHSRERGRRGGREEREREGRGRRELAGTRDRKRKTRETHGEWIHSYNNYVYSFFYECTVPFFMKGESCFFSLYS